MLTKKQEWTKSEREMEQAELEEKVDKIKKQMEECHKHLKLLDEYSKEASNFV